MVERYDKEAVEINKRSSKCAWELDKLKAEREYDITIDIALWMFEITKYYCTIINASGHCALIKNMITSGSLAGCATLILDSTTGGFEISILKLGMVVTLGSSRLIIEVKSIEMHYVALQEALLSNNVSFNVESITVEGL
ncbi:hypothetical protein CRYUN_Cryun34aG0041500 [Craigia yunnanensis]